MEPQEDGPAVFWRCENQLGKDIEIQFDCCPESRVVVVPHEHPFDGFHQLSGLKEDGGMNNGATSPLSRQYRRGAGVDFGLFSSATRRVEKKMESTITKKGASQRSGRGSIQKVDVNSGNRRDAFPSMSQTIFHTAGSASTTTSMSHGMSAISNVLADWFAKTVAVKNDASNKIQVVI